MYSKIEWLRPHCIDTSSCRSLHVHGVAETQKRNVIELHNISELQILDGVAPVGKKPPWKYLHPGNIHYSATPLFHPECLQGYFWNYVCSRSAIHDD